MIFKPRPRFDQLDQYLARRDYISALEAISEEIKQRPENFNLLLRQAEILGLAGDRERAIGVYRDLAKHYANEGFYARAIAVTNKILRLDPARKEVTAELADLISAQQAVERASRERLAKVSVPARRAEEPAAQPAPAPPRVTPPTADQAPAAPVEEAEAEAALDFDASPEEEARERDASRFFAAFPRPALDRLLSSTSVVTFGPGNLIMREGDPGRSMFLIADGDVEVSTVDPNGARLALARLGAGEFFGEVATLTGRPRTATVAAIDRVTVIEISGEELEELVQEFPEVRAVLQRFLEQRASATVEAVLGRMRGGGA